MSRSGYGDTNKTYFALRTGREFASALMERMEAYYRDLLTSGRLQLYRRLIKAKHMGFYRGGGTVKSGVQDEYTLINVNHFANILKNMVTMTSSVRPAFDPRATNTDHKSKAQALVARGVLDYYNRDKGMGDVAERCTKGTVLFGETEALVEWDAKSGDDFMADPESPGNTIKEGDVSFRTFGPIDCIRDAQLTGADKMRWRIYRDFENRHELIARFPEARDRILNLDVDVSSMSNRWLSPWSGANIDNVPFYTFYHDRTDACPNGRMAIFVDGEGPLMDMGLNYKWYPGIRMAADEHDGTPFGASVSFDMLPISESIDMLCSIIQTNQETFGVQNILIPTGCNMSLKQLADGLNALYYDPKFGKPEPLQLLSTPKEIFDWIDYLIHMMETISGVNSVARGNPEASLKSGAALALVQSMAIQFNSDLQKAYAKQVEGMGTSVVQILGTFPKTKRIVEIAGKANRSYMKEFTADDLSNIKRVTVDMGNPLARTTAGKVQMAEDLLGKQLVNAEQYIQVLNTGTLEPLIEGKTAELMLICSENEEMAEGNPAQVAITDAHALHIQEHKVVLASPEAREDVNVVKAVTAHITEHIKMLETLSIQNPNLLIALGQQPVQPPAPPQGPLTPPPPGGSVGGGAGGGPAASLLDATDPTLKAGKSVQGPQMPKNPLTDERAATPPLPTTV